MRVLGLIASVGIFAAALLPAWADEKPQDAEPALDDSAKLQPGRGNSVDHDALFSGTENGSGSATPARLWRLTGQAYEEFMREKNLQFKLGIKDYGDQRIRSPWNFTPQWNFSDYAATHKIGEAEIEYHMRNATTVAKALIARHNGKRPSAGYSDWIAELNVVLKAADSATAEQIQQATDATFKSLLGREPSAKERERYTGFLAKNLQTLAAEPAVEQFLIAILFQPEVTYRIEFAPVDPAKMLEPRQLARALAFALTDREPDETLRQAAADGKLATREQVREQVVRMLSDQSLAKPRILRFFREYFGHHAAKEVFKDEVTIKECLGANNRRSWHPYYFVSDADRLIEWALAADKQVLRELLTTNIYMASLCQESAPRTR